MNSCDSKKKVVVFDFDGTIVNSMESFADIAAEVMPKYLPISAEVARLRYLETSGIPFFEQLETLFPGNPANSAAAMEFEASKIEGYFDEPIFEDAVETVKHLKEKGIKVVVSSNNFQHLVERFVSEAEMEFDMVLGYKDGFAKGAAHFTHVENVFGAKRDEIAFVGDSLKDGERALGHGVSFIGKEGIFTREDFREKFPEARTITNLSELKTMFP